MPSVLMGNTLGLLINVMCPQWAVMVLFVWVMIKEFINIWKR